MKDSGVRSMLKQTLSTVDFHEVCERTLNVTAPLYHAAVSRSERTRMPSA